MSSENNNNGLKVALGILAVLLIGASALFFLKNNELNDTKTQLNNQIEVLEADLTTEKNNLDTQIAQNEVLNEDLIAKRDSLTLTIEALKASQADVETLMRYKNQYFRLKKDIKRLMAENEELQSMNTLLAKEKDSVIGQLNDQKVLADSLSMQVADKDKIIQEASEVTVAGLKGLAIIERSSGKQVLTEKARRADKLKVCFAVAENKIAAAEDKELFIQVLDANNNVLGENAQVQFDDKTLNYSLKTVFSYNNKALNICEYVNAPKDGFEKGNYFINVFKGSELIANSTFELK